MLKPAAFATSLAILTGAFYLLIHLIRLIAPILFRFIYNAQFMGADVASLMWGPGVPIGTFIISFILAVLTAWLFGYVWAWLYNKLAN
jgi:ABC-type bacteriocin/lantibiotic exporter with double-glycine peptidase domain